ncbi:MAG: hypothetical protein OHK0056_14540 [Bacteriovoracaceae bacterium]
MSCDQKTTNKKSTTTSGSNPITNPTYPYPYPTSTSNPYPTIPPTGQNCANGATDAPGVADAGQTIEYYKIQDPPVVAHGKGEGEIVWSSLNNLPPGVSNNIFYTDARFNLRVIPRRRHFGTDSMGVPCQYYPQPYTKLQVGVRVRKQEAATGDYYTFDNVPVNCPSATRQFQVPEGTNFPLVVEVMNIKWDWPCQSYANQGYPNVPGVCPWDTVWTTECVQVELQFSTDSTKDLPGPRAY